MFTCVDLADFAKITSKPLNIIEGMRGAYQKSQEFLQTEVTTPKEKEIKDIFKKQFLRMSGSRLKKDPTKHSTNSFASPSIYSNKYTKSDFSSWNLHRFNFLNSN